MFPQIKRKKSGNNATNLANETKKQTNYKTDKPKSGNLENGPLNKDSVLVKIWEIPNNTYYNAIKMENMILKAFPQLKEPGTWTKYVINKRHKNKCYVTLPKAHYKENTIRSQSGFEKCKIDTIRDINDVPLRLLR